MDITTIKDLITIFGFIILLWNQSRARSRDVEDKTANWTKINVKLDGLCNTQTDIKDSVRMLERERFETDKRLALLEEMLKVANHRIDDLEKKE